MEFIKGILKDFWLPILVGLVVLVVYLIAGFSAEELFGFNADMKITDMKAKHLAALIFTNVMFARMITR